MAATPESPRLTPAPVPATAPTRPLLTPLQVPVSRLTPVPSEESATSPIPTIRVSQPDQEGPSAEEVGDAVYEGQIFAPPAYATSADFDRQAMGPSTSQSAPELLATLRDGVLGLVPPDLRDGVAAQLDARLGEGAFDADFQQATSDQLTWVLPTARGNYVVTVKLRLGDWEQITDTRGQPLNAPPGAQPPVKTDVPF